MTKELGGFFGVVNGRVSLARVKIDARSHHGLAQHCLSISQAAKAYGVKATERMEWVAAMATAKDCHIQKSEIKGGVMPHQDRPLASGVPHSLAYNLKNVI